MSRATPDLTQGFTGISLPSTGPRQMGTDADGRTSVITFLNQVMQSAASLHDNQTDTRPDYLPINGLWCYTDTGGNKVVYQYDGTTDVELWTITGNTSSLASNAFPVLVPIAVPFSTVLDGFLSVCVDNGILTEASFPDAYAQLVAMQTAGETNIVTMAEYASEISAQGGVCGRFALDATAQTFRIPCAPGAFWRGASADKAVGSWDTDRMRPITAGFSGVNFLRSSNSFAATGAFTSSTGSTGDLASDTGPVITGIDSGLLGPHYAGTETAPMHVVADYQMKMQ